MRVRKVRALMCGTLGLLSCGVMTMAGAITALPVAAATQNVRYVWLSVILSLTSYAFAMIAGAMLAWACEELEGRRRA